MVQANMNIDAGDAPEADDMEASQAVVRMHPRADRSQHLRIIEAILFAAEAPVAMEKLQAFFPWTGDDKNELPDEISYGK